MSPTAAGEPPTSPLADLIGARREELLRRWTQRVAERYAPGPLTRVELADHLPEFLDTLEASLRAQVTHPNERASMAEQTRVGALHGQQRYRLGFDIEAVIREYGALREILFDLLEEAGIALSIGQTRVLLEAITVAISEAVTHYAQERDKVLRQSEARFRSLVLAGSRIVWTTDVRGQATEDSPSWRAFTGQTQEEYLAEDGWLSAIHPDDRERSRAAWRQAVATRQPYAIEHRVRRHDGAYRDMAARAVPVASEPREVPEWVGTHVDLTEQKQAERALRESEDRQRLALGSAEMGTFDNDLVAGIMAWDERSKALFGVNPEDVPTLDLLLSRVHPDDRPTLVGALHRAIQPRSGGLYEAEYRIRGLTEGRERWVAVRGRVHFDARNEPVRLIGTVQDITRPKGVEAALRETSERLRAVLDTAVDGIITIDERGIIQTVNAATVQLFQYAPEELIGQNVKVLMPEPYRREHDSYMARYRDTGVPRVIGIGREVLGQRKDGSVFPLELAVAESKWQGGRIFTGMVRDITQRKQAEHTRDFLLEVGRALAESLDVANVLEALTSLVVSRVADYCIVDLLGEDGRLHRSKVAARDPAMLEVLRQTSPYAPRLGTGSPLARSFETGEPFLVPDITPAWLDATAVDAEHRGLLERLAPRGAVFVPLLARGRKLGIFNLVWRTPNQATPETMEVARAVADRTAIALYSALLLHREQQSRAEAERSLALVDALLTASPIGIAFFDRELRYVRVNETLAALNGLPVGDHIGRPIREVIGEEAGAWVEGIIRRLFETGEPALNLEFSGVPPGVPGPPRSFLANYYPVRTGDGHLIGAGAVLADITDRKKFEEELHRTAEFRERFIGIVSHDLRGPVNAIKLSSALLQKAEDLPDRLSKPVARISSSADRMARMISDLLDFTRGRLGGGIPLTPQEADLRRLVRAAVEEFEVTQPKRRVAVRAEGDLTGRWDPDRLVQVVGNLLGNALNYSPEDSPVDVLLRGEEGRVRFEVTNGGTPIPPEVLPRIFEPFRRGFSGGEAPSGEGLGLGLFIVQQIVLAHGGTIEVRSSGRDGTTFTVVLPREAPARTDVPSATPAEEKPPG